LPRGRPGRHRFPQKKRIRPLSQTITVPARFWSSGITPSKNIFIARSYPWTSNPTVTSQKNIVNGTDTRYSNHTLQDPVTEQVLVRQRCRHVDANHYPEHIGQKLMDVFPNVFQPLYFRT